MAQNQLRLPHVHKLDVPLEPGESIVVRGQSKADTVVVNLAVGNVVDVGDIVLHLSLRIKDNVVVLNSMNNGNWGKEERHKHAFEKNQPLVLRVRCHPNKFGIFVDGKELGDYIYRQPLSTINYVQVYGDLTLNSVGREGNYYSIPYKIWLQEHFGPSKKLDLSLVPDDEKFEVNFMCNDDIAFHFTPRFFQKRTVQNSFVNGEWGHEDVPETFPFTKKKGVDLSFICDNQKFTVYVNGSHYCSFAHRMDPSKINNLAIKGNLELQLVNVQ